MLTGKLYYLLYNKVTNISKNTIMKIIKKMYTPTNRHSTHTMGLDGG